MQRGRVLYDEGVRTEAMQIIRSLVDKVVLSPRDKPQSLKIELYGDLARILALCGINHPNERQPGPQDAGCQF
jgi:hypothetical protein